MMENSTCKFCTKKFVYTCPRCHIKYCSSKCYNSSEHLKCTEEFYKEQVLMEVAASKPNFKAKKEMIDILKRTTNNDFEGTENHGKTEDIVEDIDEATWIERFGNINFDNVDEDLLWEKLTKEEQEEFCALLNNTTRVRELVPVWQPWWHKTVLNTVQCSSLNHPPNIVNASLLLNLQGRKLSSTIQFNILNILCAYVLTCRIYNGDHHELATKASQTVLQLSGNLRKDDVYEDSMAAISSVWHTLEEVDSSYSNMHLSEIIKDVLYIIQGPNQEFTVDYIMAALSDLYRLFARASKSKDSDSEQRQLIRKVQKKIIFLTSWVNEFGIAFSEIIPLLREMQGTKNLLNIK